MIVALSGTPGTGKTTVALVIQQKGITVMSVYDIAVEQGFLLGYDHVRGSHIIDVDQVNAYVKQRYQHEPMVFIEGHLSHLLSNVDKVIVLRCHPKELKKRLKQKNWAKEKIRENIEAEVLDVILCEAVSLHKPGNVFEFDTTGCSAETIGSAVVDLVKSGFSQREKYAVGKVDWSEELLKDESLWKR